MVWLTSSFMPLDGSPWEPRQEGKVKNGQSGSAKEIRNDEPIHCCADVPRVEHTPLISFDLLSSNFYPLFWAQCRPRSSGFQRSDASLPQDPSRCLKMSQAIAISFALHSSTILFFALTPVYKMMRCDTLSSVLIVQRPAAWDRLRFRLAWLAYLWVRTDNFETNWYAILDCWWYLIYAFLLERCFGWGGADVEEALDRTVCFEHNA